MLNGLQYLSSFFVTRLYIEKKIKNIKNVKRCRDGMPKSMQTR